MPHSLGPVVIAATVAQLVGLLLVAAIFAGLRRSFPRPYVAAWSWSWLAGAVRAAAGVLVATLPGQPGARLGLTLVLLLAAYLQASWLLQGAHELRSGAPASPRRRRLAIAVPLLLSLASAAAIGASVPRPGGVVLRQLLPGAALALAATVAAIRLWRPAPSAGTIGSRLMAGALLGEAALHVHGSYLSLAMTLRRPIPGYPVYLGFVELGLLTALGIGAVWSLLEEERARLRQSEDTLRQSEERFACLAAASFEGVAISEKGVMLDVNEQLATMLGCPAAELAGRPIQEFVDEPSRALVEAHVSRGSHETYAHQARRRDGSTFPVEIRARSVPYQGRHVRLSAVRDVSERAAAEARQQQLESELRAAAEEWRQTFDALEIGLVLADPGGRIVRVNRKALGRLPGRSASEVAGRVSLAELAADEPWRTLLRLHTGLAADAVAVAAEVRDAASGSAYYVLASPWRRDSARAPWSVLTFRDVTDFVAVQEQLRGARLMEAMGALVAGVAHEVRNPLFSISATVDAMEAGARAQADFGEHLVLLRAQVVRLTRLMQDLLDYGRPAELSPRPSRLEAVVERAARACTELAQERKVRLELDLAQDLPTLHADAARLEQVCQNLIANALQHSPRGSLVRVAGRVDREVAPPQVLCTVEDSGPGLPAGQLARIFEPFFTRRKGGTGLGLSIVQRLVEAHGGEVRAMNLARGGARFEIRLPTSQGA